MHNSENTKILPESVTAPMRKAFEADLFDNTIKLSPRTLLNLITTLKHARTFITSKQKMYSAGVELYDELIIFLEYLGKEEI